MSRGSKRFSYVTTICSYSEACEELFGSHDLGDTSRLGSGMDPGMFDDPIGSLAMSCKSLVELIYNLGDLILGQPFEPDIQVTYNAAEIVELWGTAYPAAAKHDGTSLTLDLLE